MVQKYSFNNIRVRQIEEGLDQLYGDFRNTNILLTDAIYVVKKQITGSSPEQIEKILQVLRSPNIDPITKDLLLP